MLVTSLDSLPPDGLPHQFAILANRIDAWNKFPNAPVGAIYLRRTGPKTVDGVHVEGTFRAHQVPIADFAAKPSHLGILERWLRSYKPEELFDPRGKLVPELAALAPQGDRRMGANPHANGGRTANSGPLCVCARRNAMH